MKIGLVGNMNNNHFAILRYLRDLGYDAELVLYSTDGVGDLSHFSVESDTWFVGHWRKYVIRSEIPNLEISALAWSAGWLVWALSKAKSLLTGRVNHQRSVFRSHVKRLFKKYDVLVGAGICPALCEKAQRQLDIFIPYSIGVEFLGTADVRATLRSRFHPKYLIASLAANKQKEGTLNAHCIWTSDVGVTSKVLQKLGVKQTMGFVPMVYNKERFPAQVSLKTASSIAESLADYDFSILAHTRLKWNNKRGYSNEEWRLENKRNDFLLRAFAKFLVEAPSVRACLVLLEYGPDIQETKDLCCELGIADHVKWLPKMDRKHICWLLGYVDAVAGEFYDVDHMLWGGVGWEAFAYGKPLIHGFNFGDGDFAAMYGMPPPRVFGASSADEITEHLKELCFDPDLRASVSRDYIEWFDEHAGIGAAKKMADTLLKIHAAKSTY